MCPESWKHTKQSQSFSYLLQIFELGWLGWQAMSMTLHWRSGKVPGESGGSLKNDGANLATSMNLWNHGWPFVHCQSLLQLFHEKNGKGGEDPLGVTPPRRRFFDDSNLLLDQPVTVTFFLFVLTVHDELYVVEMDFLNWIPFKPAQDLRSLSYHICHFDLLSFAWWIIFSWLPSKNKVADEKKSSNESRSK